MATGLESSLMALDNPLELAIVGIVIVVFLVMGPKKIPELARALGMAKKEFTAGTQSTPVVSTAVTGASIGGGDELMIAAQRLGISTEGKTREQISAEIVHKTAGA
jgi:sec-independent protein translocase protein TatA